jgi:hypothetical protein
MMTSCLAASEPSRRFWSPLLVAALFGAVISIAPNHARADEATAEALFQAGKGLMDQKKYAEACPKLEASFKLGPAVGTMLNLADCHEKEGKLAQAWGNWGDARDQAKRENDKPRMELAARRQKELDPRVPKLTVNVTGAVNGLDVYRDELQLESAMLGVPLPVDPGVHIVTLRRGKSVMREKKVEIAEKATDEVTIDATGIPVAPPEEQNGASGGTKSETKPKVVMVRKSKGMMAGGIVLASVGGVTTLISLPVFGASIGGGAVVLLLGAGMTTGGIAMAVKGSKKVPKPATAFEIPPPSVFVGPGSIMIRGQF